MLMDTEQENKVTRLMHPVTLSLEQLMKNLESEVVLIPKDGHCLLNSVVVSFSQNHKAPTITAEQLKKLLETEFAVHMDHYAQYLTSKSASNFKYDLQQLFRGVYDTDAVDVVIPALCNALQLDIIIFQQIGNQLHEICQRPSRLTLNDQIPGNQNKYPVTLLRSGTVGHEHFDAIVKSSSYLLSLPNQSQATHCRAVTTESKPKSSEAKGIMNFFKSKNKHSPLPNFPDKADAQTNCTNMEPNVIERDVTDVNIINFQNENKDGHASSSLSSISDLQQTTDDEKSINKICMDAIGHLYKKGRHYVFCKICTKNVYVVRNHSHKQKVPAIATDSGTIFRREVVLDHLQSNAHKESLKCERLTNLSKAEIIEKAPLDRLIRKGNEAAAKKIGSLMITVYNDAKRLTLSAYSWPSRIVASKKAQMYANNDISDGVVESYDLQYVTPTCHQQFLECIVESHRKDVFNKIVNAQALSLRLDGSVDRTQIDKIYFMGKIILQNGESDQVFLGLAEPQQRGAKGMIDALKEGLQNAFGEDAKKILQTASSVVTDGASVNIGEKNGLWTMLTTEINSMSDNQTSKPFLKIWCGVHRAQLAWHSVTDTVVEVKYLFQNLANLVTYFHSSGVRTRELKQLAEENNFQLLHLPSTYEVRWTQFSYTLVNAVLVSWQALASYLRQAQEKSANGHFQFITNYSNLKLLTFLADILFVFARFQQRLQRDSTTLIDMHEAVNNVQTVIASLRDKPLLGGWQETFLQSLHESEGKPNLKGFELLNPAKRRLEHHRFVTDKRDIDAVCNEVVESLNEFLRQRFAVDSVITTKLYNFVHFNLEKVDIRSVHASVGPDLDLSTVSLEYQELASQQKFTCLRLNEMVKTLSNAKKGYSNVCTMLARILAAKPHSADVERCISANNLLKTSLRSSLRLSTEALYLFIHHNLPPVADWNPTVAACHWLEKPRRHVVPVKAKQQAYFKNVFYATSIDTAGNETDDSPGSELDAAEGSDEPAAKKGRHF